MSVAAVQNHGDYVEDRWVKTTSWGYGCREPFAFAQAGGIAHRGDSYKARTPGAAGELCILGGWGYSKAGWSHVEYGPDWTSMWHRCDYGWGTPVINYFDVEGAVWEPYRGGYAVRWAGRPTTWHCHDFNPYDCA